MKRLMIRAADNEVEQFKRTEERDAFDIRRVLEVVEQQKLRGAI